MKATDYITRVLYERGVRAVFEMSGGMITHLLDSMHLDGRLRVVSVHHEQAAAFAAEGAARMTGVPGVALATSGPGATNLLTGIGSCHFDSVPAVFITGQVNRHEQKGSRAIRQLGFQETDIVSMARPITKQARLVNDIAELPDALAEAFDLALSGRPGPVLLDLPMDVQRCQVEAMPTPKPVGESAPSDPAFRADLFAALRQAERPLILAGGGVLSGRAVTEFRAFVEALGAPVVNSLMAVDVLPYDHPLRIGMIGTYGNRWANIALAKADVLVVLGSRLDVRQTGADTEKFRGDKRIYQVDVEPGEMNNRVTGCRVAVSELRMFLENAVGEADGVGRRGDWMADIAETRAAWPDDGELPGIGGINPNRLMHLLSRSGFLASAAVADVGQHQMWAAQSLRLGPDQRFLNSGGMGAMGFALPTAIGAAVAVPGRPVLVVAGDGGFQTNIQELETVRRNNLPLKIVILNNRCHGMVRQFQESYFEGRYQSTMWGYTAPDFEKVAAAYGIAARTVADPDAVPEAVEWLWADPAEPALLQVTIDPMANAYPKVAFGRPITDMEPHFKPVEMEST